MKRIKKIFVVVHIVLWILLTLLVAFQLKQDNSYWFTLTVGVILTSLYVFYSHFFLLTHYSGKKKSGAYLLRLSGIIFTGPFIYLFLHNRKLDTLDLFFEYYSH